ncbi:S-adenosylmethionine:tRNA ribosyltransferase-isomerase [Haladaptatus sp. GCM10025707]|uniref:S-adenosylmethionine:tRNA ribosyltransferase-isomerase n=1 Tax=unclassified Haladaptatus TaxID=2622732 RepID=UPI0023E78BEE|nr:MULTISPECIES: S-adenosylmethionine:tRNA ribosyltransferase-isomerase [unclassified Haladaptatus]
MQLTDLQFERPQALQATEPPEERGLERDEVRLLVSEGGSHHHDRFLHLADALRPGDLLIVNQSATIPATLPATGPDGAFILNLCTDYGHGLWLTEPRRSASEPGPLSLSPGDRLEVAGLHGRVVSVFPNIPRLTFVRIAGDVGAAMATHGSPIRYGYLDRAFPLSAYQTYFATTPGSAEMPSAARPFTARVVDRLRARGVGIATLTLHTGVSSLEVEADQCELGCREDACLPLYPEPFSVPAATARAISATKARGGRVVAVGTTVVRAVETAWDGEQVRATGGFTRRFISPDSGVHVVDGLLTGLHDPQTTHLAMLYAIAGRERIMDGYREAIDEGYLWHEFGDSHLILA